MFSKNPRWSKRFGRSETFTDTNNVNGNLSSPRSKPNQSSNTTGSSKKSPTTTTSASIPSGKSINSNPIPPRPKKESLAEFLKKSREARTRFEKASKEASEFRQYMKMNFQKLRWEREKIRKLRLEGWIKQQFSLVKIRDRLVDIIDRLEDQEKEKEKEKFDDTDFDASFFRTKNGFDKKSSKRRQNNKYEAEYLIITGGHFGLGYRNLQQSPASGKTFSIDIDVTGYLEKEISIETEDNRMIIKGLKENVTKAITIIAPTYSDIEGMIIKPPSNGTLSIEAP